LDGNYEEENEKQIIKCSHLSCVVAKKALDRMN
jgi:hypothetical protein